MVSIPKEDALRRKAAAKRSQALGKWGQARAAAHLRTIGLKCVEEIHTGTAMVRGKRKFTKKVSGDIRAVMPRSGRSVLVEVKVRQQVLHRSDLESHQREALQAHSDAGAIALVAWIDPKVGTVWLLCWPILPGVQHADAERLDCTENLKALI